MDDDEATVEISEGVGAGPPADTSAPADGTGWPQPAAVSPPGRSRLAVAMLVVSGLLLIGAVVFGVLGFSAQSEASDQRDKAAVAVTRRHDSAGEQQSVEAESDALLEQLLALPDKYDAIGAAERDVVDAHNRYTDISNRSVELYNNGDTAGSVTVLQNEGVGALSDLDAKKTAAEAAVKTAEDALREIKEGL